MLLVFDKIILFFFKFKKQKKNKLIKKMKETMAIVIFL